VVLGRVIARRSEAAAALAALALVPVASVPAASTSGNGCPFLSTSNVLIAMGEPDANPTLTYEQTTRALSHGTFGYTHCTAVNEGGANAINIGASVMSFRGGVDLSKANAGVRQLCSDAMGALEAADAHACQLLLKADDTTNLKAKLHLLFLAFSELGSAFRLGPGFGFHQPAFEASPTKAYGSSVWVLLERSERLLYVNCFDTSSGPKGRNGACARAIARAATSNLT